MTSGTNRWTRAAFFHFVLFALLLLSTVALAELALRAVKLIGPSTFPFRKFDPQLGVSLIPGAEGVHRRCYNGYVKINQYGMRDKERRIEKPPNRYRVAVFSDSLIEAVHVLPDETATAILEERLNASVCGGTCEVLNFAVGGFSALENYIHYMRDGRRFGSDLIILVLTDNDLPFLNGDESHGDIDLVEDRRRRKGSHIIDNLFSLPRLEKVGSSYRIVYPDKPPYANMLLTLFRHSDLAYFLYKVKNIYWRDPEDNPTRNLIPGWARFRANALFLDPGNPVAARAWQQTAYLLDRFVDQVRRDGAEFLLVHWGYDVGSNPWYKPVPDDAQLPGSFDPQYASKWFSDYAAKKGIGVYNLSADIAAYIERKKLKKPYLSFSCDMHFNPEGQALIAELLFGQLSGKYLRHYDTRSGA